MILHAHSSALHFQIKARRIKGLRRVSLNNAEHKYRRNYRGSTISFASNQQYHYRAELAQRHRVGGGYRKGKIGKFHTARTSGAGGWNPD